jgi:hypothetical protein
MKFFKIILLLAVGLGIAWAEGEQASVEQPEGAPPDVKELSQEELDAEMRRMDEVLGESSPGESGEVKEFIPTKPLAADLPVALPSDI